MGPSGSGKSVVGAALADRLDVPFMDADDLHPVINRDKMTAGVPLTDEDRMPWLDVVAAEMAAVDACVMACSALARRYRDRIRRGVPDAFFIELETPPEELERRMRTRTHFMPAALLASQLATLEPVGSDEHGVRVPNVAPVPEVVSAILAALPRGWRRADQSLR